MDVIEYAEKILGATLGDIVKTVEGPFKVVCEKGAFWLYDPLLLSNDHLDFLGSYETEAIEVIGNIHDNSELLGG